MSHKEHTIYHHTPKPTSRRDREYDYYWCGGEAWYYDGEEDCWKCDAPLKRYIPSVEVLPDPPLEDHEFASWDGDPGYW